MVIGKNVIFNIDNGKIVIGNNCVIAGSTRRDVPGGEIEIGDGVLINSHCIITSWRKVEVGNDTRIAPFCHITDRVHGVSKGENVKEQVGYAQPISIGRDVWIASSCIILKGVTLGDGVVIYSGLITRKNNQPVPG